MLTIAADTGALWNWRNQRGSFISKWQCWWTVISYDQLQLLLPTTISNSMHVVSRSKSQLIQYYQIQHIDCRYWQRLAKLAYTKNAESNMWTLHSCKAINYVILRVDENLWCLFSTGRQCNISRPVIWWCQVETLPRWKRSCSLSTNCSWKWAASGGNQLPSRLANAVQNDISSLICSAFIAFAVHL